MVDSERSLNVSGRSGALCLEPRNISRSSEDAHMRATGMKVNST